MKAWRTDGRPPTNPPAENGYGAYEQYALALKPKGHDCPNKKSLRPGVRESGSLRNSVSRDYHSSGCARIGNGVYRRKRTGVGQRGGPNGASHGHTRFWPGVGHAERPRTRQARKARISVSTTGKAGYKEEIMKVYWRGAAAWMCFLNARQWNLSGGFENEGHHGRGDLIGNRGEITINRGN